jgi:hypothetical protein
MKSISVHVLVTFGVIFLIFVMLISYLFVSDPYGWKPLIFGSPAPMIIQNDRLSDEVEVGAASTSTEVGAIDGFILSDAQVSALVSLGIDPGVVPSSISSEQEECFVGVLGETRTQEIKAGAVPSAFEFLKAEICIK